jgi:hypothetical protein
VLDLRTVLPHQERALEAAIAVAYRSSSGGIQPDGR